MAFTVGTKSNHSLVVSSGRTILFMLKQNHSLRGFLPSTSMCSLSSISVEDAPKTKPFSEIPGPLRLPVFGTTWTFFVGTKGQPLGKRFYEIQAENVKKYGKVFRNKLPGVEIISLSDPADVAKLLRSDPKYPERLDFPSLNFYREKRKKIPGVFFADGEEWYKLRSVLSKRMLRPKEVADYTPGFNKIIGDFIHRLRSVREPSGSEKENEVCELDNELFKWSFESVAEMLFDKRFGCLEEEINQEAQTFIKAVGDFLANAVEVGFLPTWFYKIYETQKFKKFFDNFDTMYDYAELFIGRRIKELEEKSCKPPKETERDRVGFFEFLLASGKLTKDDLLASVIDVLFAGVDTTSNTMQWVLYMLAKNPEKQKILRREVLSVVGNSTFATPETLARMPYLKAWLRETLRLYPVLSAIPRRPKEDIILGGYHIPGGTAQVDFLVHQMGRDESIFEDAEAFKPERWLRNKDTALIESAEAFASLPFGFGTRMCLGRRIAELELHLLMARIVQQFDISYPPEAENVEPFMRGVTIPDRPVRVQFVDRK